ncbi:MAG: ribonuclease D [Saprospiraceae bacterium]|nr:ribonuclease D [Saprospiraceae bacterium]
MTENKVMNRHVHFVDSDLALKGLWDVLDKAEWLGFDTEFIGENREIPLLCLLQVITEDAIWLVDTIHVPEWEQFGHYLTNPDILKLTHAGENDYRLMYQLLGVLPRNTFDLQVAVGFTGLRYPASLTNILLEVLGISSSKGFTVADWTIRPLPEKMKHYAIEDVRYLEQLYSVVSKKLVKLGRLEWVRDEMKQWEVERYYQSDPLKKLLQQKSIAGFGEAEKLFMMRLAIWRVEEANQSGRKPDEILNNKQLMEMARVIHSGSEGLFRSRILPKAFIRTMKDQLLNWYGNPPTANELATLYAYAPKDVVEPAIESQTLLVLQLLQTYCMGEEMSIDLLLPASESKKYRIFPDYRYTGLYSSWRSNFLPDVWKALLENRASLKVSIQQNGILLSHA